MTRIIFDLDGTLIDSAPDIHLAVNLMLSERNLAPLDLADVTGFIGNGVPNLVRLAMQARDIDMTQHDACVTSMAHHYGQVNGQLTRLYPGVRIALEQLQRNGHTLALCTNKPLEPARQIVETFELTPLFDQIIGGDSLAQRKPEPAMLLACQRTAADFMSVIARWMQKPQIAQAYHLRFSPKAIARRRLRNWYTDTRLTILGIWRRLLSVSQTVKTKLK